MKNLFSRYLDSLLCFLIAFSSCENKSTFLFDTKEVDYISDSKPLIKGSEVNLEILGVDGVFVCDTLLMFISNDPSGMLQIYNKNTLSPIAKLATQGRANNEFIRIGTTNWQYYYRDGDLIMPFIDNGCFLKEINISQSILQKHTILASDVSECINITSGSFVLLDNDINNRFECNFANPVEHTSISYLINHLEDKSIKEIPVFPKMIEQDEDNLSTYFTSRIYNNRIFKHPTKNIVVQPFSWLDYILFFDLENKHNFAIHNQGSLSFSEVVPTLTKNIRTHFLDYCFSTTNDYFMILYLADQYTTESKGNLPELLIFDWEGNYLSGAKLDEFINSMSYDPSNKILYGVRYYDEKIFTFDLSELMASIDK